MAERGPRRQDDRCSTTVLGVDGAGVSLAREGDDLTFVTATDAQVAAIEEQQMAIGAGPCQDAFHTGDVVAVRDLDSRVVVEQAKGVIAERGDIPPQDAFELIRTHARRTGTRVHETAQQVVDGVLDL